nr:hypothetical protein Iba_chr11aCG7520 [Ipomoea batatas]
MWKKDEGAAAAERRILPILEWIREKLRRFGACCVIRRLETGAESRATPGPEANWWSSAIMQFPVWKLLVNILHGFSSSLLPISETDSSDFWNYSGDSSPDSSRIIGAEPRGRNRNKSFCCTLWDLFSLYLILSCFLHQSNQNFFPKQPSPFLNLQIKIQNRILNDIQETIIKIDGMGVIPEEEAEKSERRVEQVGPTTEKTRTVPQKRNSGTHTPWI